MIPKVIIPEERHWKVGDGIDVNGGETIGQIALVFTDDTHFQVRLFSENGRHIMTTPGVVDKGVIENSHGKLPKASEFKVNEVPQSTRRLA